MRELYLLTVCDALGVVFLSFIIIKRFSKEVTIFLFVQKLKLWDLLKSFLDSLIVLYK